MLLVSVFAVHVCKYFPHLSLGGLCLLCMLDGGAAVVPPGQWGAEPLHLTQVDEEGAV